MNEKEKEETQVKIDKMLKKVAPILAADNKNIRARNVIKPRFGYWIMSDSPGFICSECRHLVYVRDSMCPYCGSHNL